MARRNYNHNNNRSLVFEFAEPWFSEFRTPFGTITVGRGILDQINYYAYTAQDLVNVMNQQR